MAQRGGSEQRGGILIRGASGHLFFMRDGDDEPRRLSAEIAAKITGALGREPSGELLSFPANERVIEALEGEVGELPFWGVIIWGGRRLSR